MELQQLREILKSGLIGGHNNRHEHYEVGDCRPLREWRRSSIPEWRSTLKTSIQSGDRIREEYARRMLREILLDPDYPEGVDH